MTCHFLKFSLLSWLFSFNLIDVFYNHLLKFQKYPSVIMFAIVLMLVLGGDHFLFEFLSSFLNYGVFLLFYSNNLLNILPYTVSNIIVWNISRWAYWCCFTLCFRYWTLIHFNFSTWLSNKLLFWNYFLWSLLFEYLFSL